MKYFTKIIPFGSNFLPEFKKQNKNLHRDISGGGDYSGFKVPHAIKNIFNAKLNSILPWAF